MQTTLSIRCKTRAGSDQGFGLGRRRTCEVPSRSKAKLGRGPGGVKVPQKLLHLGLFRTIFHDSKISKMFCKWTFLCAFSPILKYKFWHEYAALLFLEDLDVTQLSDRHWHSLILKSWVSTCTAFQFIE